MRFFSAAALSFDAYRVTTLGSLHDERLSDIWALGVTMYEIVVGRTPFEKTDAEEFLTRDALEIYCTFSSLSSATRLIFDLLSCYRPPNDHRRILRRV